MRNVKYLLAGIGAVIVALLMICGPGACRHPLLYALGWLAYIPLGCIGLTPLIMRISTAIDQTIASERDDDA